MASIISSIIYELDSNNETQLRSFYDDILNKTPEDEYQYFIEIINVLIQANLSCVDILDHSFFIHIRNIFIDYLQKSIDDFRLPYLISQFFLQLIDHVNDNNLHFAQQFFANANLTDCLIDSLKNVSSTSNANFVGSIEHMIDTYQILQDDRISVQNDPILLSMMMPIVDFVKSSEYINVFLQLSPHQQEFTHYQKLILVTCQKYVSSHWGEYYDEVTSAIAQHILSRSPDILQHALKTINHWQTPMIWSIFSLILVCQYCANQRLLPAYDIYHKQILDCVLEIVQGKELWQLASQKTVSDIRQKRASQLLCYATLYIYTMTFLPELRDKLKENNATTILLKLAEVNFDKTQFHAYRALAAILTDNDIKQLANPTQITTVFITYLKKSIDTPKLQQRLANLLLSLKSKLKEKKSYKSIVKFSRYFLKRLNYSNEFFVVKSNNSI